MSQKRRSLQQIEREAASKRPSGVLAESEAEQRTIAKLCSDQLLGQGRRQAAEQVKRWVFGPRQADQQAVVAVQTGGRDPQPLPQPSLQGQLEREVELSAERREDRQSHLSGRVPEALDQDRPVVGDRPDHPDLSGDVVA